MAVSKSISETRNLICRSARLRIERRGHSELPRHFLICAARPSVVVEAALARARLDYRETGQLAARKSWRARESRALGCCGSARLRELLQSFLRDRIAWVQFDCRLQSGARESDISGESFSFGLLGARCASAERANSMRS